MTQTAALSRKSVNELSAQLGKLPPQAIDLEEAVLGALLLERDALTAVVDILHPETFYREGNQEIFRAIVELFNDSQPVDLLTVTDKLRRNGKLEMAGGAYYITNLTTHINSAANIEVHARIITEQHIKRELIFISSGVQRDAYDQTMDVFELLDRTEATLFHINETHIRRNFEGMDSLLFKAISQMEQRRSATDGLTGIPSGFTSLDRLTGGWQPSDLIIIAARPGMGKTALIVSAVRNASVEFRIPCAVFSLEMSSLQLTNRLMSAEAEIGSEKIKKGQLESYEWEHLIHKTAKLEKAPIYIDDTPALSIMELRAKARRLKAKQGVQLIVIDYLQLMKGDTGQKGQYNREQEISSITRALKSLAKELNIPVIALSQLSRAVETRGGDKRPQLSDLRESGAIEQDADMVMFLYRPEYYGITQDENGLPTSHMAEVIIAKHRNGSLDTVQLKFIGKFTKFADLDPMHAELVANTQSDVTIYPTNKIPPWERKE